MWTDLPCQAEFHKGCMFHHRLTVRCFTYLIRIVLNQLTGFSTAAFRGGNVRFHRLLSMLAPVSSMILRITLPPGPLIRSNSVHWDLRRDDSGA